MATERHALRVQHQLTSRLAYHLFEGENTPSCSLDTSPRRQFSAITTLGPPRPNARSSSTPHATAHHHTVDTPSQFAPLVPPGRRLLLLAISQCHGLPSILVPTTPLCRHAERQEGTVRAKGSPETYTSVNIPYSLTHYNKVRLQLYHKNQNTTHGAPTLLKP
jgi:hypothetical protein